MNLTAITRAPAKLNLFLELLSKRGDGFHEIDTVMVPIDWCDELRVTLRRGPSVTLDVRWQPSNRIIGERLGNEAILDIPRDEANLVHRALRMFSQHFAPDCGFHCQLLKQIPAGAGMGGASSDAAAALRCAAELTDPSILTRRPSPLVDLAAQLGSDVPFFLGGGLTDGGLPIAAARARGRGEIIQSVDCRAPLYFVVAFPNEPLSTANIYANSLVPHSPNKVDEILAGLAEGDLLRLSHGMMNRLSDPARKIVDRIDEMLESLWRSGLIACQLTGSGSACFGIAQSYQDAIGAAQQLRARLEPGALVMATQSTCVPMRVERVQTEVA